MQEKMQNRIEERVVTTVYLKVKSFPSKYITSHRVIIELENLITWRVRPEKIRVDNGPEFIAERLSQW